MVGLADSVTVGAGALAPTVTVVCAVTLSWLGSSLWQVMPSVDCPAEVAASTCEPLEAMRESPQTTPIAPPSPVDMQFSALVLDQDRVKFCPCNTVAGVLEIVTVGAGGAEMLTVRGAEVAVPWALPDWAVHVTVMT